MSGEGSTPLHLACHRGHAACIVLLLRDPRTAVNAGWTTSCVTPLFLAVKQGCEAAVAVILREPAVDPNCRIQELRATPLHMAVYNSDAAIVARLVQRADTNVRARTRDGVQPVDIALMAEQSAIVWLLVKAEHRCTARRSEACWQYLCLRLIWHCQARTPSETAPAALAPAVPAHALA